MSQQTHKRDIQYSTDYGHPWEPDVKAEIQPFEPSAKEPQYNLGEIIFGKGLKWYKEATAWPMFILLLAEIGVRAMQTKYFPAVDAEIFTGLINFTRLAAFIYLTIYGVKCLGAQKKQIMAAAVLGGLVAGVILAVFQLFWYFKLWAFFNLIGQPLLLAAQGLVVSWLTYQLFFRKKN